MGLRLPLAPMARLIAFLSTAALTGFLAALFSIPNLIPIMLIVFCIGMGCGMKFHWAVIGSVLTPVAMVAPMRLVPGPEPFGRLVPPDDSQVVELIYVNDARAAYAEEVEEFEEALAAYDARVEAGTAPEKGRPEPPTLHESNVEAVEALNEAGEGTYGVWPLPLAFVLSLGLTIVAWVVNTVTTRPFRDPQPLGAP